MPHADPKAPVFRSRLTRRRVRCLPSSRKPMHTGHQAGINRSHRQSEGANVSASRKDHQRPEKTAIRSGSPPPRARFAKRPEQQCRSVGWSSILASLKNGKFSGKSRGRWPLNIYFGIRTFHSCVPPILTTWQDGNTLFGRPYPALNRPDSRIQRVYCHS